MGHAMTALPAMPARLTLHEADQIGYVLRTSRLAHGQTTNEIAARLNITRGTVGDRENGRAGFRYLDHLIDHLNALGYNLIAERAQACIDDCTERLSLAIPPTA
jgi:transcriptional regulator with XRE-family HTH domain